MLKELVKLSNSLDRKGLHKEADVLDKIIYKMAQMESNSSSHIVREGETFSGILQMFGSGSGKTFEENVALNKKHNPSFNPNKIYPGQTVYYYNSDEAEGNQVPLVSPPPAE